MAAHWFSAVNETAKGCRFESGFDRNGAGRDPLGPQNTYNSFCPIYFFRLIYIQMLILSQNSSQLRLTFPSEVLTTPHFNSIEE